MKDITKHYSNGEVTVVWKPALCIHSKICWQEATGLPQVFHPATRPWITPEHADTERIIEQINKCPSGALSFFLNGDEPRENDTRTTSETIAEVMPNGPLLVYGNLTVKARMAPRHTKPRQRLFAAAVDRGISLTAMARTRRLALKADNQAKQTYQAFSRMFISTSSSLLKGLVASSGCASNF